MAFVIRIVMIVRIQEGVRVVDEEQFGPVIPVLK